MSGLPKIRKMLSGTYKCFVLMVLLVGIISVSGKTRSSCKCIPLKECPSVNLTGNLSDTTKLLYHQFLKRIQCGSEGEIEKICCPDLPKKNKPPTRQSKMLCSNCVIIKNCRSIMNALNSTRKPLGKKVVDFLRSKECGFENNMPKVCCSAMPVVIQDIQHTKSTSSIVFTYNLNKSDEHTTAMSSTRGSMYTSSRPSTTKKVGRKANKIFDQFKNQFFLNLLDFNELF